MGSGNRPVSHRTTTNPTMLQPNESDPHGFIAVDEMWRCTRANAVAGRLLRVAPAEIFGQRLWKLLPRMLEAEAYNRWRRALQEKRSLNLGEHLEEDRRRYSCHAFPASAGVVICLLDVTERYRAMEAMREERRRIDEALAVLAHELRNSLSGPTHSIALLRMNAGSDARGEMLQSIETQLGHLKQIVDNLLDVSNIERGRVELHKEEIDLGQLIASAVGSNEKLIREKRHDVRVDVPHGTRVSGDATRLLQVLVNLLRNAVSYTDRGGTVSISARRLEDKVEIRMLDTGRGIAPEKLPHLFEQSYDYVRDRPGIGVGLGVVQRIVQLHGGSVTAHSNGPGRGSEFTVHIPAPVGDRPQAD